MTRSIISADEKIAKSENHAVRSDYRMLQPFVIIMRRRGSGQFRNKFALTGYLQSQLGNFKTSPRERNLGKPKPNTNPSKNHYSGFLQFFHFTGGVR